MARALGCGPREFIGACRVLRELSNLGIADFKYLDELKLPLEGYDVVIFAAYHPSYNLILPKVKAKKWLLWTSPILQSELTEVEIEYLQYILRNDDVERVWLGSRGAYEALKDVSDKVFYCHPPWTKILTLDEVKPINEVRVGDLVLTHTGEFKRVKQVLRRFYKGDLIEIVPYNFTVPTYATSDHLVLAVRAKKCSIPSRSVLCKPTCIRSCAKLFYEEYTPQWIPASELRSGYCLAYPKPVGNTNRNHIDLGNLLSKEHNISVKEEVVEVKQGSRGLALPRFISINDEFMEVAGYYLSEGGPIASGRAITFTFNINEMGDVERLRKLVGKLFWLDGNVYDRSNVVNVTFSSKVLTLFFTKLFGAGALNKKIPPSIFFMKPRKIIPLIRCFWRGDGCKATKCFMFSTSSPTLAHQIKLLLLRLNIIPRIYMRRNRNEHTIEGRIVKKHPCYTVKVGGASLGALSRYLKEKHPHINSRNRTYNIGWIGQRYIYLPVRKLRKFSFEGEVYNLEVEGAQSYLTESITSHNCPYPLDVKRVLAHEAEVEKEDAIGMFLPFHNKQKNVYGQLAACKILQRDNQLKLYTNGMSPSQRRFANILGLSYKDLGFLPEDEYYRWIQKFKLMLHITLSESFAYAVMDALLLGTPCLVSPAINWVDPSLGLTVENLDSPVEIAEKMEEVIASPPLTERVQEHALKVAEENNRNLIKLFNLDGE